MFIYWNCLFFQTLIQKGERLLSSFMGLLEMKVLPVANKIGSQRHLLAIRHGVLATLPLTIIGSFFVILLNFPIDGYDEWIAPYRAALDVPFRFTVGAMALYAAFGVGSALAGHYKLDQLSAGLLSVLAFLITCVVPTQVMESVGGDRSGSLVTYQLFKRSLFIRGNRNIADFR